MNTLRITVRSERVPARLSEAGAKWCAPVPTSTEIRTIGASVRALLVVLLVVALPLASGVLGGCHSTPDGVAAADDGSTSWTMTVDWQDSDESKFARYEIRRDGTIAFGGGFEAVNRRTTWAGPLDGADREALWNMLREDGWLAGSKSGSGEPAGRRSTVRIRSSDGERVHRIRGESDAMDRLRAALDHASRGRFDSTMRALPRAGDPRP